MTDPDPIRGWLAETIADATDGTVSAPELLDTDRTLVALGVNSMALIRVIDAVESHYDVVIDFDDGNPLESLDRLTEYVAATLSRSR